MNFYQRHLGDFAKDTAHLSQGQIGAYNLLLDFYYASEKPLPIDSDDLYRIARAATKDEKKNAAKVIANFFVRTDAGYSHKRVDEEIARAQELEPERDAKRENERERQRRSRERRRELFEQLRERGMVPAFDATTTELQELLSREMSRVTGADVTRDDTVIQTPDSNNQKKQPAPAIAVGDVEPSPTKPPAYQPRTVELPPYIDRAVWQRWCQARTEKRQPLKPTTVEQQLKSLATWQASGQSANQILEQSIRNGWAGLFELKGGGKRSSLHVLNHPASAYEVSKL